MSDYPTVAVCVGHSRKINDRRDGGAISVGGVSEWHFNSGLAEMIGAHLTRNRIRWFILDDYAGKGYTAAMAWVADQIADRGADVAVELHFNASPSPTSRGHEWLYWHSSKDGKRLAECLDYAFRLQLPPHLIPARGIKPVIDQGRGSEFLRRTHCPAAIAEPFFGSNEGDWKLASANKEKIAIAIANGLAEWLE